MHLLLWSVLETIAITYPELAVAAEQLAWEVFERPAGTAAAPRRCARRLTPCERPTAM